MRRLPLVVWAVYLIVAPTAWAASGYTIVWPDLSPQFHDLPQDDLSSIAAELTTTEQDAISPLLDRRRALRIRGLELRYTIGKTVSSEGADAASLASIRHQVEAIEVEMAFIDHELSAALAEYSKRTGPWLVVSDDLSTVWFVPSQPCLTHNELTVAAQLLGDWRPVSLVTDPLPIVVDAPGACPSFRFAIDGLDSGLRPSEIWLRVNGEIQRFLMPH